MTIQRIKPGPRMSGAVVHGNTVYLAGQVASQSAGQILAALTNNEAGGEAYDKALPERQRTTLY